MVHKMQGLGISMVPAEIAGLWPLYGILDLLFLCLAYDDFQQYLQLLQEMVLSYCPPEGQETPPS